MWLNIVIIFFYASQNKKGKKIKKTHKVQKKVYKICQFNEHALFIKRIKITSSRFEVEWQLV